MFNDYEDEIRNPQNDTKSLLEPTSNGSASLFNQVSNNCRLIDFEFVINHPEKKQLLLLKYQNDYSFRSRVDEKLKNDFNFRQQVEFYLSSIYNEYCFSKEMETLDKQKRL